MAQNILKDLFSQKRYNEVIENLKIIYVGLYNEMLNFKGNEVKEEYNENSKYYELIPLIRKYYPQFSDNITLLDVSLSNVNESYLDNINDLLTTYLYFKENYKLDYDKEKYKEYDIEDSLIENNEYKEDEELYNKLYDEIHKNENNQ